MAVPVDSDLQKVRAQAKWARMSARKARLVLDHIRGRTVPEARTILAFTPRAAATEIERVLRSAVANAEANHGLDGDELVVAAAYADEGPTLKRWRARARGRVNRVRKRTCHITLVLAEVPEPSAPRRRRAASKPATEEQAAPAATKPARARKPRTSRAKKKEEGVAG
jgi:large subunit ribosomal protein L22